jgi:hypothetical protein
MRKGKLMILALSLLALLFCTSVNAQTTNSSLKRSGSYKDPFLAGVLSWVMPGAGQIYAHSYAKGSLFILGDLVDKTALVMLILYLNNNYSHGEAGGINWKQLSDTDKGLIVGYIVLSSAYKVYNSLDAVASAKQFNSRSVSLHLDGLDMNNGFRVAIGVSFRMKDI